MSAAAFYIHHLRICPSICSDAEFNESSGPVFPDLLPHGNKSALNLYMKLYIHTSLLRKAIC
jgi:hypothetical protein